jgi:hypothetical protein
MVMVSLKAQHNIVRVPSKRARSPRGNITDTGCDMFFKGSRDEKDAAFPQHIIIQSFPSGQNGTNAVTRKLPKPEQSIAKRPRGSASGKDAMARQGSNRASVRTANTTSSKLVANKSFKTPSATGVVLPPSDAAKPKRSLSKKATRSRKSATSPVAVRIDSQEPIKPDHQHADLDRSLKGISRSHSIAVYRKNGPLDAVGYWLRSAAKSLRNLIPQSPARFRSSRDMEVLMRENESLRQQVERLLSEDKQAFRSPIS